METANESCTLPVDFDYRPRILHETEPTGDQADFIVSRMRLANRLQYTSKQPFTKYSKTTVPNRNPK